VCDLETSRIGAPYIYIYDISSLRVNQTTWCLVPEYSYLKTTKIKAVLFARFSVRRVRKFPLVDMSVMQ